MQKKFLSFCALIVSLFLTASLRAETITIAAGAGYKRPLMEIAEKFEKKTGNHVDAVFGHMQQILSQAQMTGQVSVIFGDRSFFDRSTIGFVSYYPVGKGTLVLAWRKGLSLNSIDDLRRKSFSRVALADEKKAIYGHAAAEFLKKSGLSRSIQGKLIVVATVPQVSAYLETGEVDAGFINVTDAIGIHEHIGGYLPVRQSFYTPIHIEAGVVTGFENQAVVKAFLKFMQEKECLAVLRYYGL
ncbi:MAG: molybdate ABC transporter substrate-binding protein [Chlorobiaceae bacterium]|nr:molybdate ABC transporter substrate-binding protein [Chlorobiaceae bacterium]NTV60280.1 molybdate ABC transporter substrate-binding protein [Chlorobiaceae bacterium]